jgi:hypothetical protein
MIKRHKIVLLGLQVLMIIVLFSLGCSTLKNKTSSNPQACKKQVTDDVVVFLDLRQIDVDNDGEKDILALYLTRNNLNGVKIIKTDNKGDGHVIFKQLFFTNNAAIKINNGIPMIIIKERFSIPFWFALKKTYRWNGEGFFSEKRI